MEYFHSFGHTKDLLVMPKNSSTFSVAKIFEGKCVEECIDMNFKNNLAFNVMNIEDGSSKMYAVDHPGMLIHVGNTYVEGDVLTMDWEMSAKDLDPFYVFNMKWLRDNNRQPLPMGYVFRRY